MRFPLRWLKQYLSSDQTPEELIETLTMGGLEVEEAVDLGMGSGRIVVAEILEVKPHPDADRLRLCKVDIGRDTPLDIVCGAPNAEAGMRVPCALVGATLPNGLVIKKSKIRGQASEGMLCAADELGLGNDHTGILALPDTYKVGEPFDYLIDIKVTPNRPDCLSVFGVARDVAAMLGKKVFPPTPRFKETLDHIDGFVRLAVKARNECPRYTCRLIRGVKVGPSPLWMQRMLEACGLRPINNVVDVTNYVLYELGHPLHAFDFDLLDAHEIKVRMAEPDEKITLLDGRELALCDEDLVIADGRRPVALAGIMGGSATAVTDLTANVLLEAAYFDPGTIRKTAKRYGISTDSSYRFERGADRLRVTLSLQRAAQLIQELAGGEIAKGQLDLHAPYAEPAPIVLEIDRVQRLLGLALSGSDIADALVDLGFEIRRSDKTSLMVAPPSHRVDITRDVDLIEEVARLHGYDKIPATLPKIAAVPIAEAPTAALTKRACDVLATLGFSEAINYSFISEEQATALGFDAATQPRLLNPLSSEQAIMRPTLLAGLLTNVGTNQKQQAPGIALFETGKVWNAQSRVGEPQSERRELAAVLTGSAPKDWGAGERTYDFYDLKGALEHLLQALGVAATLTPLTDSSRLHPGRAAQIECGGKVVGSIGELHPDLSEGFDLRGRVYQFTLDLTLLANVHAGHVAAFQALPKFPASERDLAVVVDRTIAAGTLLATVREEGRPLVEAVSIVDLYQGEHIADDKKSLALRLRLRSADETLTEEVINATVEKVMRQLAQNHGAVLRS
jgi:phenylalanyl-tRNA synthetase beta chain